MKANSWWIKTDYWMQTIVGGAILVSAISIVGWMLALVLLAPFGGWQVVSGLVHAFSGDRLRQIYVGVVAVYFIFWHFLLSFSSSSFAPMMGIAIVIGIWKYTVVRADYKSLDIISVRDADYDDLLDA